MYTEEAADVTGRRRRRGARRRAPMPPPTRCDIQIDDDGSELTGDQPSSEGPKAGDDFRPAGGDNDDFFFPDDFDPSTFYCGTMILYFGRFTFRTVISCQRVKRFGERATKTQIKKYRPRRKKTHRKKYHETFFTAHLTNKKDLVGRYVQESLNVLRH
jgi:hypothetical protein